MLERNGRALLLSGLVAGVVGLSGCGLFGIGGGGGGGLGGLARASRTSVGRAANDGNWDYIRKVCSGEQAAENDAVQRYACDYVAKQDGPSAAANASCEEIVSVYSNYKGKTLDFQHAAAKRFAECGHYTELFEKLVHWGNNDEGVAVLVKLEDAGLPVEAEWVKYLQTHKGPKFFAVGEKNTAKFALDCIGKWLLKKGHTQHCAAVVASATGASETARVWVMPYLKGAECAEGGPLVSGLLLSDTPDHRRWACQALGKIGGKAELGKVKTLAETDGYNTIREEERDGRIWAVKIWPVREACNESAGKIHLRLQ